jgi:hypothetical protein
LVRTPLTKERLEAFKKALQTNTGDDVDLEAIKKALQQPPPGDKK